MNFETKYLIRWGIPGWIMVMVLFPYFVATYFDFLSEHVSTSSDLLAVGAILSVLGVPLGYLLNQIHHSLFWVLPKKLSKTNTWEKYFEEELVIDKLFDSEEKHSNKRVRYSYLLSRKHELGGITVSLGISAIVIGLTNLIAENHHVWTWVYFVIVLVLFRIILLSRNYSSDNIQKYHDHYMYLNKDSHIKKNEEIVQEKVV
jgi:hypothetical protein